MLTFTQLREQLGLSQPALTKLIRDGLPHTLDGRTKLFDDQAVARWLLETGRATVEGQEDRSKIARTSSFNAWASGWSSMNRFSDSYTSVIHALSLSK